VTSRNDIVLDAFSGSGTSIIACAKVGRRGFAVELDPHYVDVGVRRWEQWSGKAARAAVADSWGAAHALVRYSARPSRRADRSSPDQTSLGLFIWLQARWYAARHGVLHLPAP
jgi:hypothetical protein